MRTSCLCRISFCPYPGGGAPDVKGQQTLEIVHGFELFGILVKSFKATMFRHVFFFIPPESGLFCQVGKDPVVQDQMMKLRWNGTVTIALIGGVLPVVTVTWSCE